MAKQAIAKASVEGADLICFPECFIPGYRGPGKQVAPPDAAFLDRAWSAVSAVAAKTKIAVVLGTERIVDHAVLATALVINPDGTRGGFQDKVQLDPSEEATYSHGSGRQIFQIGPLTFGIVICHEGWRYPETGAASATLMSLGWQLRVLEHDCTVPGEIAVTSNSCLRTRLRRLEA